MSKLFERAEFEEYQAAWQKRAAALQSRKDIAEGKAFRYIMGIPLMGPWFSSKIKPLFTPIARAIGVDTGIIPGGWLLSPDTPEDVALARDALFAASRWRQRGPLYVRYGATYGLTGLKVADLRAEGRVVLAPLNPMSFILFYGGVYDNSPDLAIIIDNREDASGEFEYAEAITPESVKTFRDGEPWGFDEREPEYQNTLGFVPIIERPFIENGERYGGSTFDLVVDSLKEVNSLASDLATIIKDHAEPQWAISGAEPSDLVKSGDNVWFLPGGAGANPLTAAIDITGVLAFIESIHAQVKGSLPELAFDELKSKDQIATATLELQLMELVLKIQEVRPNLDDGLVLGMQLAGLAAQDMGLSDIAPLAFDDLSLDPEREILPLDPLTRNQLILSDIMVERERAAASGEGILIEDGTGDPV